MTGWANPWANLIPVGVALAAMVYVLWLILKDEERQLKRIGSRKGSRRTHAD